MVQKSKLKVIEVMKIFEYRKSNNKYWNVPKLYHQVITKTLPIAEALYPSYSFLFLFDNLISHFVYAQNALCIANMNKRIRRKQLILRDR